jgi:ARG and Rhodanese-Phosphatase-superfamily-associated Protein domain
MQCGRPSLLANIGLLLVVTISSAGEHKAGAWRLLEGVSHENLTVFSIVLNEWADTGAFVTLDEALTSGEVIVTEQGSPVLRRSRDGRPLEGVDDARVDRLVLVNRGPESLVLLAGEVLSGGKQDRVVAKDRVVPAGGPLPLDVFCVERGRWALTNSSFSASKLMLHPSVREQAAVEKKQAEVWATVREGTTSSSVSGGLVGGTPAESPRFSREALERTLAEDGRSESYAKLYQAARLSAPIETFAEDLGRQFERATAQVKGVVGVVVTYGSNAVWCDRFASPNLFRLYWPKLLRSYVVEALTRSRANEHASLAEAREFLRGLGGGRETLETEPGVYRWRQLADDQYAEIELQAISPITVELHWMKIRRTR